MRPRPWPVIALLLLLAAASLGAEEQASRFPNLQLEALDGQSQVELASFRGRPVLLTFWASWCGPCRTELPELERLYGEMMGHGLVVLTVSVDRTVAAAERFMQRTGLRLPVYRLGLDELRKLGLQSIPTSVLLDGEGRTVQIYAGYSPKMPAEIEEMVLAMGDGEGDEAR